MQAEYPPFMFGYGMIADAVAKIQDRDAPEVFNHEYLRYTLGFGRESDRAFIPLFKRIGFLTTDGRPTALYQRLRDPKHAAAAVREAMQAGYPMLYAKHADADTIDRKSLAASVAEVTGLVAGHTSLRAIVGTFLALRELASATATADAAGDRRKVVERRKGA